MWTRAELKSRAKLVLKVSYWQAFLVSLIIALAQGGLGGSSRYEYQANSPLTHDIWPYLPIIISVTILVFLLALAFRLFLGYPLEIGGRKYFIGSTGNKFDLNKLSYAFHKEWYMNIVLCMLWRDFINFMWFLLFIIPGIIKFYAFRMVPYILADNPHIDYKRALELSTRMTGGHKWAMFVLDLSFIGWYLLGMLAFLIGTLFVLPYQNATLAELYIVLRTNAIDNQWGTLEELGMDSQP